MKKNRLVYDKTTRKTYLYQDKTILDSQKGYKPRVCSCGQGWVFPEVKR